MYSDIATLVYPCTAILVTSDIAIILVYSDIAVVHSDIAIQLYLYIAIQVYLGLVKLVYPILLE